MNDFTTDQSGLLAHLTFAGAMVSPSNLERWLGAVLTYGEASVLAVIDELHADTRQIVIVTDVTERLAAEAKQKQEAADDAAEDAAMQRQLARKVASATAVVVSKPASVAAATDAHPIHLAEPANQEITMLTIKQLVHSVEDEIARRNVTTKDAMIEIGTAPTALYAWRKGSCGDRIRAKIEAWLSESATKAGTATAENAAQAKPAKSAKPKKPRADKPATITEKIFDVSVADDGKAADLVSLLTQGENLSGALNALGATGYADVVQSLVDRLRAMRAALSA